MILACHLSFGAYGFWLPNDPRGSWSDFVRQIELRRFGWATKTDARHSLAHNPHDHQQRQAAKRVLRFPPVHFTEPHAAAIAQGFAQAVEEGGYVVYACAIMPDHVHLVVARHTRTPGQIIGHVKARATQQLHSTGLWLEDSRPVWADRGWKVFLDSADDVRRAIRYVEQNPVKARLPPQRWSFVAPYETQDAPGKLGR